MLRSRPLGQRLVARAFVLGLDPALDQDEQGEHLARLANGSAASLKLAIRGIEAGPDRESSRGVRAIAALQAAVFVTARDAGLPQFGALRGAS